MRVILKTRHPRMNGCLLASNPSVEDKVLCKITLISYKSHRKTVWFVPKLRHDLNRALVIRLFRIVRSTLFTVNKKRRQDQLFILDKTFAS